MSIKSGKIQNLVEYPPPSHQIWKKYFNGYFLEIPQCCSRAHSTPVKETGLKSMKKTFKMYQNQLQTPQGHINNNEDPNVPLRSQECPPSFLRIHDISHRMCWLIQFTKGNGLFLTACSDSLQIWLKITVYCIYCVCLEKMHDA